MATPDVYFPCSPVSAVLQPTASFSKSRTHQPQHRWVELSCGGWLVVGSSRKKPSSRIQSTRFRLNASVKSIKETVWQNVIVICYVFVLKQRMCFFFNKKDDSKKNKKKHCTSSLRFLLSCFSLPLFFFRFAVSPPAGRRRAQALHVATPFGDTAKRPAHGHAGGTPRPDQSFFFFNSELIMGKKTMFFRALGKPKE